jgi:hypothetical protein
MQLLHSPTPLCRCAMADGLYLCLEISFFQKFKSSILFLLKSSSCSQGSILFTLLRGLFSRHLQGTIPLELSFSLTPSEIFSNTLPVLDLQSLSTVLKSSRFGALAATTNLTFPFSDLSLRIQSDLHSPAWFKQPNSLWTKREQKFNCLASSTHSMRRNSTALYAGISWLKQRNN